jgi:hypothetical protein
MVKGDRQAWKAAYFEKARKLLGSYEKIFICDADNVTSKQFQEIRTGMRGQGEILMGKNTMMKKAIREVANQNPAVEKLLPLIKKNVGFVMTNGDLKTIRDLIQSYKSQPLQRLERFRRSMSKSRRNKPRSARKRLLSSRPFRFQPRLREVLLKLLVKFRSSLPATRSASPRQLSCKCWEFVPSNTASTL